MFSSLPLEAQVAIITTLVGGLLGITGTIIGIFAQEILAHRRAVTEKREQWIQRALAWAANGRKESLRHADLCGADLQGVDLAAPQDSAEGVDLSYSDLRKANLNWAKLCKANLNGVDLREASLILADLRGAVLYEAKLDKANLANVIRDDSTLWPTGFTPPPQSNL